MRPRALQILAVEDEKAVAQLAASICAHRFLEAADASTQLAALKEKNSYQRDKFVENGGWVTFADAKQPVDGAGALCAELLMAAEPPAATTPAGDRRCRR